MSTHKEFKPEVNALGFLLSGDTTGVFARCIASVPLSHRRRACVSSHRYCNCLRTLKEGLPDVDAAYRCRLFWVLPSNCLCDET
ncbi:hypothetical protein DM083_12440, partial [Klebsiella pneumoniae]